MEKSAISSEIFRKDVTYDNIKSHKKAELHSLSIRYIFGKTTGGGSNWPAHPGKSIKGQKDYPETDKHRKQGLG